MIIITGAAGFIGSCLLTELNHQGQTDIGLVDDFSKLNKKQNYEKKAFTELIDRNDFIEKWLPQNGSSVSKVYHLGARTDTTEFDWGIFQKLNVDYSKALWNFCSEAGIPFIYASSAATYGSGEQGFRDDHQLVDQLAPLNPYGRSKLIFDQWVLTQVRQPGFWAGLRFFNVYGPNEGHKGRMASVIFHAFNQIQKSGQMKLFRSHRPDYADGHQKRDFIYVKDVVKACTMLGNQSSNQSGIYNIGTGQARTFLDLVHAVFHALKLPPNISFIDTPEDIREKYQYFTEADMSKWEQSFGKFTFHQMEDGVADYVRNYLVKSNCY